MQRAFAQVFIWLYYISPFAYTNQALMKVVFRDLTLIGWTKCLSQLDYPCYGESGKDVLEAISTAGLQYADTKPWAWFAVLVAFAVGFRAITYTLLRRYAFDLRRNSRPTPS